MTPALPLATAGQQGCAQAARRHEDRARRENLPHRPGCSRSATRGTSAPASTEATTPASERESTRGLNRIASTRTGAVATMTSPTRTPSPPRSPTRTLTRSPAGPPVAPPTGPFSGPASVPESTGSIISAAETTDRYRPGRAALTAAAASSASRVRSAKLARVLDSWRVTTWTPLGPSTTTATGTGVPSGELTRTSLHWRHPGSGNGSSRRGTLAPGPTAAREVIPRG
ncbi:MAG: hypothetical protein JWR90_1029 [Marmoricola sp.]|nr:hypothetical protein [Marmoricola sp.]